MYHTRNIVGHGTINLGTRDPRTFVQGHIVSGRAVTPPLVLPGVDERIRDSIGSRHPTVQVHNLHIIEFVNNKLIGILVHTVLIMIKGQVWKDFLHVAL